MAGDPDPYDTTLTVIEARLASLESGAPASGEDGAWTQDDLKAAIVELQGDREVLRAHWRLAPQTVAADEPTRCATCSEPRDCSTVRALFSKYAG